jgi:F0F1-type ATP synthase assembly protein I
MGGDQGEGNPRQNLAGQWIARLSGIILILPASMAAGWVVGYFLIDRMLNFFPWGSIILTLLGAGAGFYEILRILIPKRNGDHSATGGS